ncbi:hypothetical protein DMB92_03660 [Campylobacter sp. MIT 99-7217]|uniref:zinc ribbon domain-containing protein n=1 Tax=Campylobacter sp. MIT 99-7217 TaxID=535091 RepID=UPI0011580906|nr:zinc ribbon domain-containing protein [Campylobacter sp. MIT 99-7217]TQR33066.1 hypothetical protein DMB92_03660 [Campylobacter sp. MIT 99-7217]
MNKYLKQLVDLSKINQEIDSFEPKVASITKTLKDTQHRIERIDQELARYDAEMEELKIQQEQTNVHIDEFAAKIKEFSKKSASIKTEKEANALRIEEDIAKEQLESANEELIRLDKLFNSKQEFKEELIKQKAQEESSLDGINAQINEKMQVLEKERSLVYEKKNKLVSLMNPKILTFYEKIRKWAKNTAVVPVKKQACYGCFMKIYDKTYLALQKSEEIVTCPHCGRILYKDDE